MAPKTKIQFEEIRQQSRASIKEAALEVFARKGFAGASISEIAQKAGISKGLMYNYFESKEALLKEIVMEAFETNGGALQEFLETPSDPAAQLTGLVESMFLMVRSNLHYWKLLTAIAFQPEALKGVEAEIRQIKEVSLRQVAALFQAQGAENPEQEAFFFGATLDGILLHYMTLEDNYPLEAMKELVIQRFCRKK